MVDDDVYDLTKFQEEHPGGQKSETALKVRYRNTLLTLYLQSCKE